MRMNERSCVTSPKRMRETEPLHLQNHPVVVQSWSCGLISHRRTSKLTTTNIVVIVTSYALEVGCRSGSRWLYCCCFFFCCFFFLFFLSGAVTDFCACGDVKTSTTVCPTKPAAPSAFSHSTTSTVSPIKPVAPSALSDSTTVQPINGLPAWCYSPNGTSCSWYTDMLSGGNYHHLLFQRF